MTTPAASDNEKRDAPVSHVKNLAFYQFDNGGARLQSVYRSKKASWHDGRVFFDDKMYREGRVTTIKAELRPTASLNRKSFPGQIIPQTGYFDRCGDQRTALGKQV
jgi:hypothetical protein